MSWNDCLYWYAQERGGRFYALQEEENDGVLLLDTPKGELLLSAKLRWAGKNGVSWDASAALKLTLERPYRLRIRTQSALWEGVHTVLGGLDRGVKRLGRSAGLYRDYGAPEITGDRGIKTNEPDFTHWVFQSQELRRALKAQPDFALQIGPVGPDRLEHLVNARTALQGGGLTVVDGWMEEGGTKALRRRWEESGFSRQIDALAELAQIAWDAASAWPMPMQPGQNK